MTSRLLATRIIQHVIDDRQTLSNLFSDADFIKQAGTEKAIIQEMTYGTLRWYFGLEHALNHFLDKPIKAKDNDLKYLLLLGIYQLQFMHIATHAVVSETVSTCIKLKKRSAKGLVNAVLRRYLREIETSDSAKNIIKDHTAHPEWLINQLQQDWPETWKKIIDANNQHPPMYLRVNQLKLDRKTYLNHLTQKNIPAHETPFSKNGLLLEQAIDVQKLPGFSTGKVSVQELAAQLATELLDLEKGQNILDACAAPGGKTAHILETKPDIDSLTAVEKEPVRVKKLLNSLSRLSLKTKVIMADATDTASWWDGKKFDRILLDAPCSATGVIRRHPDIKLLRTVDEVSIVSELQFKLLYSLWELLKNKGLLVYATCSVLKQENEAVIKKFTNLQTDCVIKPTTAKWGHDTGYGQQILTGEFNMDGFFYACLEKQ